MRTIETADVRRISVGTDGLSVRWMGLDRFLWCGCVVTGNGSGAAVGGGGKVTKHFERRKAGKIDVKSIISKRRR